MPKQALVVGASSGMGEALVRRLASEGYRVAMVARRQERLDALCDELNRGSVRVSAFSHDVRLTDEVSDLFDRIVSELDGLDTVIYCAGVMPSVSPDEYDESKDRQMVEVNVIGAMAWLNAAARRFQVMKSGTIVGIGSVAGDRGRVGQPGYNASKAALHTYLEALRNRLSRHGVRVVTIKPGPVHTPMTEGLDKMPMAIDATTAADGIYRSLSGGPLVAYVPGQWRWIMAVIRSIPSVLFRRMDI